MKRYNGWGDDAIHVELPDAAGEILGERVGPGVPVESAPLKKLLKKVPPPRIPETYPGMHTDARTRFEHAHGQSMPDWIAMRFGTMGRFPDAVAMPDSEAGAEDILDFADKHDMVVVPYGGGTSVVGHLNVPETENPVLSLSMEKMNGLLAFEPQDMLATFGAGVTGPQLEATLNDLGYTLGHYPQSFDYSTLGGWVVTRSSGQQSLYYGRIEDLFAGGRLISPRGRMEFPPYPASAAGPDLRHVVLGSEGRLGLLTQASVRISAIAENDHVYGVFFPDWDAAVSAVFELANSDVPLSMIRLSNPMETYTNLFLAGHENQVGLLKRYLRIRGLRESDWCMMLMGLIGPSKLFSHGKSLAGKIIRRHGGISTGRPMGDAWRKNRFRAPYLRNTLWENGYAVDTLETATNWSRVTPTIDAVESAISGALDAMDEKVHVFTHLSHVYSSGSSIYTTYVFRIAGTPEETIDRWQRIKSAASRAIVEKGGTISHQHGVGEDHKQYLEAEKGKLGIDMLNTVFAGMDPRNRMNPGKLTD